MATADQPKAHDNALLPFPPFFPYAHDGDNTQPPYMMAFAPSMVYAYPPPATAPSLPPALAKPKRKQVKMACTNCAAACKKCDESRPCERCLKYGVANTCVDGQRKERKKGIKRGPYKRKNKSDIPDSYPTQTSPSAPPPPPIHQLSPEGFYPVYYGPPSFLAPTDPAHPPTNPDGTQQPLPHPPPMLPPYFYPYPPFAHYPPMPFPPPPPPHTLALPGGAQQPSTSGDPAPSDLKDPTPHTSPSSPPSPPPPPPPPPPLPTSTTSSTHISLPTCSPSSSSATATATKKRSRASTKTSASKRPKRSAPTAVVRPLNIDGRDLDAEGDIDDTHNP